MSATINFKKSTPSNEELKWRLMLPPFVIIAVHSASVGAVLPILPFYLREMGASPLIFGLVLATEAVTQSAASPLLGQLSDRYGRKAVILWSQVVATLSLLLLVGAQNIFTVLLARLLFGLTAGNFSAAIAYAADNTTASTRRQAIGVVNAGLGLGSIVGAGLSSFLSEISLTAPIYLASVLAASGLLVSRFFLMESTVKQSDSTSAGAKISLWSIARMPVIRVLLIVMLCHFFAYGMYTSQLPNFLTENFVWNGHAFGPREFGYMIAADGLISILAQLFLLGWIGRFFSERQLIVLILLLICVGFVCIGFANSLPLLAIAILCVSIGDALAKPAYLAALSVHVPAEKQGVVMGTGQALVAVTDIFSPVLGGIILSLGFYSLWIGIIVAVAFSGALFAAARLPRHALSGSKA